MREGVLPRTLHVDQRSSKVDWEQGKIELLDRDRTRWEKDGTPAPGGDLLLRRLGHQRARDLGGGANSNA